MGLTESKTRSTLIDPALRAAAWRLDDRSLVRFEIPVDGYDAAPWNGVTDYCLYDASGNVLAVIEAKRCSRNPREADEQLRHYVTEIAKRQPYAPFGFMSNGHSTYFWEVGEANPRLVAGFFTPDDLQRLLFLRQNQLPLDTTPIDSSIVERPYAARSHPARRGSVRREKTPRPAGHGHRNGQDPGHNGHHRPVPPGAPGAESAFPGRPRCPGGPGTDGRLQGPFAE